MHVLSAFAITQKGPAQHPDRIQLYSLPAPSCVKVSIEPEELGLKSARAITTWPNPDACCADCTSARQTARDVLHNPRESVVVRIGMGYKASFCGQ